MNTTTSMPTVTIYYDGLCPLCAREIAHYRRRTKKDETIQYVDIAAADFDATSHGLDEKRVHQLMHVKVGQEVHVGIDAFIALWERVRGFGGLARIARLPVVYQLLKLCYAGFARIRPLLPRRKADCPTDACPR